MVSDLGLHCLPITCTFLGVSRPQWVESPDPTFLKFLQVCFTMVNVLNLSITLFHTFLAYILPLMQLFLRIPSGIVNSVDLDQTAPAE